MHAKKFKKSYKKKIINLIDNSHKHIHTYYITILKFKNINYAFIFILNYYYREFNIINCIYTRGIILFFCSVFDFI